MKKRRNFRILPLLLMGIFLVFAGSCEKDNDNDPSSNNPTNGKTSALFNTDVTYGTLTDQDGNVYKTVTIGTQTWMAENLRTIKYNDGIPIPNVSDGGEWVALTTAAYCNYNNATGTDTIATYGRLYNWYAVNTGKLAPEGWHVPTDAEWTTLTTYLGGQIVAGGKLKEIGITHWESLNTGATNESGFTALPAGHCSWASSGIGINGWWWSATESSTSSAVLWITSYDDRSLVNLSLLKEVGLSVRCVKD
jgi:uncharacterized protein (TIGR02145 family)